MKSVKNVSMLLAIILSLLYKSSFAQCSVSSIQPPDIVTNTSFSGSDFDWDDATDVLSSNNQYASAGFTLGLFTTVQSDFMMLTDFDISIPLAVTICGIEVKIERKASGIGILGASVRDNIVQLLRNGVRDGNDKSTSTNWTGSKTTATYGSSSDNWGTSWTAAEINNGNFGLAFSAELRSGAAGLFLSADIDNITITVYYQHIVLPVSIAGFQGTQKGNTVELTWETKEEKSVKKIILERQSNHYSWETIQDVYRPETITQKKTFLAYDFQPQASNNYRLKIIDTNNNISYSEITNVKFGKSSGELSIDLNSSNKTVMLLVSEPILFCKIFRADGLLVTSIQNPSQKNQLTIPLGNLPEGNLVILVETRRKRMSRHIYIRK